MRTKPPRARFDLLQQVAMFSGLSRRELARVDRLMTLTEVETGQILTTEGTTGRQAFIMVAGRASVTIDGRPVATVGPGEVVGEMALIDGQPRTATVKALEPLRVLVADARSFRSLLYEPTIAHRVLACEVRRLRIADWAPAAVTSGDVFYR